MVDSCAIPESGEQASANYSFEKVEFEGQDPDCQDRCALVSVEYEKINDLNRLNQAIAKAINEQLKFYIRDGERYNKLEDLSKAFVADYNAFLAAFPESSTPWTIEIEGEMKYASEKLFSYQITTNSYTGGAHPNEEVTLLNLDVNGRELPLSNLIKDMQTFKSMAEKAFRQNKGLTENANYADAGFMFEDNKFQLPKNIGFTGRGLRLYYNDYDIASQADGPTDIILSFDDLEGVINL
jgi:hypothetical protein